jgi:hypothetical protein
MDVIYYTQLEILKWADYFAPEVKKIKFEPKQDNLIFAKKINVSLESKLDLLILLRSEHGKAAWLGDTMAQFIAAEGFTVTTVGHPDSLDLSKSSPNIRRLPGLPWKKLQSEFSKHRAFYDPSLYEGYGLTPREALHHGCKTYFNSFGDSLVELAKTNSNLICFRDPFDILTNMKAIKDFLTEN